MAMQSGPDSPGSYIIGHFFRDAEGRSREEVALKDGEWRIEVVDVGRALHMFWTTYGLLNALEASSCSTFARKNVSRHRGCRR
jgi:hypothetical protein